MGMGVVGCVAEACMHCTPKTKGCDKLSGIAIAALASVLIISVMHWFPWRALLHRDLHRIEAYILGIVAILAPAISLLWTQGNTGAIAIILACSVAAGVATIGAKAIDKIAEYRNELHDRRNRDA